MGEAILVKDLKSYIDSNLPKKQIVSVSYSAKAKGSNYTAATIKFDFVPDEIQIQVSSISAWRNSYDSDAFGTNKWEVGGIYTIQNGGYIDVQTGTYDSKTMKVRWELTDDSLYIKVITTYSNGFVLCSCKASVKAISN